jgi:hypothetical protein
MMGLIRGDPLVSVLSVARFSVICGPYDRSIVLAANAPGAQVIPPPG